MTIKRWELKADSSGDSFQLYTDSSDQVAGVNGKITNVGNVRPAKINFWLPPSEARALGEMLIAASKEANSL